MVTLRDLTIMAERGEVITAEMLRECTDTLWAGLPEGIVNSDFEAYAYTLMEVIGIMVYGIDSIVASRGLDGRNGLSEHTQNWLAQIKEDAIRAEG